MRKIRGDSVRLNAGLSFPVFRGCCAGGLWRITASSAVVTIPQHPRPGQGHPGAASYLLMVGEVEVDRWVTPHPRFRNGG